VREDGRMVSGCFLNNVFVFGCSVIFLMILGGDSRRDGIVYQW
jgi:hypothetical protein